MNKWPKKRRVTHGDRKGFTLLEMSIVIFIIALLIMIIVPNITKQKDHATSVHTEALQTMVQTQAELYLEDQQNEKEPDTDVSLKELFEKNYLTQKQYNKAKETMTIERNHVVPDKAS